MQIKIAFGDSYQKRIILAEIKNYLWHKANQKMELRSHFMAGVS